MRSCGKCGAPTSRGNRCAWHEKMDVAADNARRQAKALAHGRNTAHWRHLRQRVVTRDGATCQGCGAPGTSVHLDPRLNGRHDIATEADCITLCTHCHGQADGGRAHDM